MNHDIPPFDDVPFDDAPFPDPAQEREWQAQERALRAERLGLDPVNGDERMRRYRLLARTLREPMPPALPDDFAQQLAKRVAAMPARDRTGAARFDVMLPGMLVVALLVASGVVIADYGRAWLPAFRPLLSTAASPAAGWLLALGTCVAATWLLGLRSGRRLAD